MRIVHYHLAIQLERGGVVRAVLDLSGAVAGAGTDVILATPDPVDVPDDWPVVDLSELTANPEFPSGRPLVVRTPPPDRRGGRFSPTVLDAHTALFDDDTRLHLHGMWSPRSVQLGRLARARRVPYVISPHGMLDEWSMQQKQLKKRAYLWITGRRWLEGAATLLCTAEAELQQAQRWMPHNRGTSLPLIMDLEPFREPVGPELAAARFPEVASDDPVCLFLSRIHVKKGVERLIEAMAQLRSGGTPVRAIVAGSGDEDYSAALQRQVGERGLDDSISFPGFVRGREKVSLYEACELFVLPTSQENFGFVIFEAMAAGTPVITTRGVDTWPEIESSGGGVVVDATPEAIAKAIKELLGDPERRRAMGAAGRAWALKNLAADAVVERYLEMYRAAAHPS
ncbi:MAG: glycosyltransferase [Phycisphaerales bacterium]